MVFHQGETISVYGYLSACGHRIVDVAEYEVICNIEDFHGNLILSFDKSSMTINDIDGSICVIIEGTQTRIMRGIYFANISIIYKDGEVLSNQQEQFEIIQ